MPIVDLEKERQIVQQGQAQGKSEEFIKQAVLRFRELNQGTTQQYTKPAAGMSAPERALRGFGMGIAKTAFGASKIGENMLKTVGRITMSKAAEEKFGINKPTASEQLQGAIEQKSNMQPGSLFTPQSTAENVGFVAEQIAEFLVPGAASSKLGKAAGGLAKGARAARALRVGTAAATEGALGGGITAIQKGKFDEDAKTAALISAAFPVLGELSRTVFKTGTEKLAKSIQKRGVIKPLAKDIEDGFKIDNVFKYNLGGNLDDVFTKSTQKINGLARELGENLRSSNAAVNLNTVLDQTRKSLVGGKAGNFGNINATKRVLQQLQGEVYETAGKNGLVDLVDATTVKQGAGRKGAWTFGSSDPDSSAIEKVYTTFYRHLKEAIEKSAPKEVATINKQLSELIPIQNAVLRRIPVAERQNILNLSDNMGLFSSFLNPFALAGIGMNKLTKSGKFANFLYKASQLYDKSLGGIPSRAVQKAIIGTNKEEPVLPEE